MEKGNGAMAHFKDQVFQAFCSQCTSLKENIRSHEESKSRGGNVYHVYDCIYGQTNTISFRGEIVFIKTRTEKWMKRGTKGNQNSAHFLPAILPPRSPLFRANQNQTFEFSNLFHANWFSAHRVFSAPKAQRKMFRLSRMAPIFVTK